MPDIGGVTRSPAPIPRRKSLGLAGMGLFVGAIGGWVAGLLRAPRSKERRDS